MATRDEFGNDDAMQDLSGVTGGIENSQPGNQTNASEDLAMRLGRLESELAQEREQRIRLERQQQSQGDKMYARLEKRFREDESAIRRTAVIEGWDEAETNKKVAAARLQGLQTLPIGKLEELDESTPETRGENRGVPENTTDTLTQHAYALRAYLAQLGLRESDLGEQGVIPFVGHGPGSQQHREFNKLVGKALDEKDSLAARVNQHQQRQTDANNVAAELEETGGLGATTGDRGQGQGARGNNALRLIEQEKQKYKASGNIAGWLAREEELRQQYGLPPKGA